MGNVLSGRQSGRAEDLDTNSGNAYCFPPKNGHYFGSHFIMGGERFETCSPEAYLFGENLDLNFLGSHPTPFPYSAPLPHEPTRTLRALINIRKESLRLIRTSVKSEELDAISQISNSKEKESEEPNEETIKESNRYSIEFAFDSDVKCAITIHYFCTEEVTPNGLVYTSRDPTLSSETYHFKKGANQLFSQPSHSLNPSQFSDEDLFYRSIDEKGEFDSSAVLPVVIHCVAEEGEDPRQSHSLMAILERNHENSHSIKPLKQKLFVDGLTYLLQEIYGIENKNAMKVTSDSTAVDDDLEDNSSECVICMSDPRDTLILPCRHLCLCNGCADSLRYQANNCPICRAPFRALLQLKAVRRLYGANGTAVPNHHQMMSSNSSTDLVDIPPGYEAISLIEALNGPNPHLNSLSYRTIETEKYLKVDNKTKKSITSNGTTGGSEVNDNIQVPTPAVRSRVATSSPTTPEVVVSGFPVSPNKTSEELSYVTNKKNEECERWQTSLVTNSKPIQAILDDNGSASSSSSSSSGTNENIALQERIRLLSNDKEHDYERIYDFDRDRKSNGTEMRSFSVSAMSPTMLKGSPENSSPLSIGMSSSSYPMLSLRDGLDEQRAMDADADLLSVATIGSTNNMVSADEHNSDCLIPLDEKSSEQLAQNINSNLLLESIQENVPSQQLQNTCDHNSDGIQLRPKSLNVKLAESEVLDDDLSPEFPN